jgi:phosphoribosylformylglycinamidine synthase
VTDTRALRVFVGEEMVADMPVPALVDDCPLYDLVVEQPPEGLYVAPPPVLEQHDVSDPGITLLALLAAPNIASRLPLFQQYDCLVQSRTIRRPEQADAAVLALPQAPRGIAISIDGSGRRVACDPYTGTIENVLECTANLACAGAEPLGLTNCLNFGNPEKPHIAWQLTESIRGLGDACRALDMPVVGGNVSLYNESGGGPIYPTPVVGIVGELPDVAFAGRSGFLTTGDTIALAGPFRPELPGSELAKLRGSALPVGLPALDIAAVRAAQEAIRDFVRDGFLSSAHDIAEGGPLIAVAESCLAGGLGATLDLTSLVVADTAQLDRILFGESPGSGFVVSGPAGALARLGERVALHVIGTVGGGALEVTVGQTSIIATLDEMRTANSALAPLFP